MSSVEPSAGPMQSASERVRGLTSLDRARGL